MLKLIITIILSIHLWVNTANAQTISTTQALSFGEGVVKNNDAVYNATLLADGSLSHDPEIVFTTLPQIGTYFLSGFPPSTAIASININVITQLNGPGQDFVIDSFDIDHPASFDVIGNALVDVGARMSTSGTTTNYNPSAAFSSSLEIEVFF